MIYFGIGLLYLGIGLQIAGHMQEDVEWVDEFMFGFITLFWPLPVVIWVIKGFICGIGALGTKIMSFLRRKL